MKWTAREIEKNVLEPLGIAGKNEIWGDQ